MVHKNVLVVDDVKDWREQLKSILKRSGYSVDTADDYHEALEKINRGSTELVIVDLRLDPVDEDNRDGMRLLEILAEKRINTLVLTGYGSASLQEKAKSLEVIGFLEKGVVGKSLEKLKAVINAIFAEIETRDSHRHEAAQNFSRGLAVEYSVKAAGYPLRESLEKLIERVINSAP